MGRKVTISFTLDTERDRDLLRWLEGVERRRRSAAIREALRAQVGGVTLGDVYQAIRDLERALRGWAAVGANPAGSEEEPPEAAAALDALGKL